MTGGPEPGLKPRPRAVGNAGGEDDLGGEVGTFEGVAAQRQSSAVRTSE